MRVWKQRFGPAAFALAGILFLVAAVMPVINGRPLNVACLGVGVLCLFLGIAIGRKSRGGAAPPAA